MAMPEDVMVEILSRLAVKTLLRFKCVCIKWRTLISSPFFASLHLNRSISNPTRHSILVHESLGCPLISLDPVSFTRQSNPELDRFNSNLLMAQFVGSINGLVCVQLDGGEKIAIWNPSTRSVIKLPPLVFRGVPSRRSICFGWDPTADDYKVVRLCYTFNSEPASWVQVWSAKLQFWRGFKVDDSNIVPSPAWPSNLIIDGFTYFIVEDRIKISEEKHRKFLIASFDMKNELLRVIPLPQLTLSLSNVSGVNSSLFFMNWRGTFALAVLAECRRIYQVWALMDNNNNDAGKESWSKKFTFQLDIDIKPGNFATSMNAIQVVLRNPGELILYDVETRETKKAKSTYPCGGGIPGAYYYVESLLSIQS